MIGTVHIFATLQLPEVPLCIVDPLVAWPQAPSAGAEKYFGNGKQSCHLTVDGPISGLHDFALRLGLRRAWFQASPPATWPHYDLTPNKRELALKIGALAMPVAAIIPREHAWRANAHATAANTKGEPWACHCAHCDEVRELGGFMRTEEIWKAAVRAARLAMPLGTRHRLHTALEVAGLDEHGRPRWEEGRDTLRRALDACAIVPHADQGVSAIAQESSLFGQASDLAIKWVSAVSSAHVFTDGETLENVAAVTRCSAPAGRKR